jgi:uncharacterized protein (DUF58 family)
MREHLEELGRIDLLAKKIVAGYMAGLHRSPYNGFSVEFSEHRQYNTGESVKNIDWKLYAKTDKLYTKLYEEETNLKARIFLDVSGSMNYPERVPGKTYSKVEFAAFATAALTEVLRTQGDAFEVLSFSDAIQFKSQLGSTQRHQGFIFQYLDSLARDVAFNKVADGTNILHALQKMAEEKHKRNLIIIFSDFLIPQTAIPEWEQTLEMLSYYGHELLCFNCRHESEEKLQLDSKFYKLVDLENGEEVRIHGDDWSESEQNKLNENTVRLKSAVLGKKFDWVECPVQLGFGQVLRSYFASRKKK